MSNKMKTKNLNIKQIIELVPRPYREETLRRNISGKKRPHNRKDCIFHKSYKNDEYKKVRIAAPDGEQGFTIVIDGETFKAQGFLHHIALSLQDGIEETLNDYLDIDGYGYELKNLQVSHICHTKYCVNIEHLLLLDKKVHRIRDNTCHGFHLVHLPNVNCENDDIECDIKEHWFNPCIHYPKCIFTYPKKDKHY